MFRSKHSLAVLALLSIVSAASAQEASRGRWGERIRLDLLRLPEVRKELAASDQQAKAIDEAFAPLLEPTGGSREAQNLSPQERQKRFEEMQKKGEAASKLVAEKIDQILNAQQRIRLKQLWLPRLTAAALIQPEVVEELGLTPEQQDKIREIRKVVENHLQPAAINPPPGKPRFQDFSQAEREQWLNDLRVLREKEQVETLAVLTDEQKARFAEMKGKEFDFPDPTRRSNSPGGQRPPAGKQ
jgi:hypothetical protein